MLSFKTILSEKKEKHTADVQRFMAIAHQKVDETTLREEEVDSTIFFENLQKLAQKWYGENAPIGDSEGSRFINKILNRDISSPILHSVITDQLAIFFKYYQELKFDDNNSPIFWLELACICGAQNIVRYLLGSIDKELWEKSENIVPYLLSSGNSQLTIEVAKMMKYLNVTKFGYLHLYSLGNLSTVQQVESLVGDTKMTTQAKL